MLLHLETLTPHVSYSYNEQAFQKRTNCPERKDWHHLDEFIEWTFHIYKYFVRLISEYAVGKYFRKYGLLNEATFY